MKSFFHLKTIEWKDGRVFLIDQTKLPRMLTYVECKDHTQVAEAIRKMVVRGAPAIGATAAMGLALTAYHSKTKTRDHLLKELEVAAELLKNTRPTAVNLFWAVERILEKAKTAEGDAKTIANEVLSEAKLIAKEDTEANRAMGKHGSALLESGDVVLTHCK